MVWWCGRVGRRLAVVQSTKSPPIKEGMIGDKKPTNKGGLCLNGFAVYDSVQNILMFENPCHKTIFQCFDVFFFFLIQV